MSYTSVAKKQVSLKIEEDLLNLVKRYSDVLDITFTDIVTQGLERWVEENGERASSLAKNKLESELEQLERLKKKYTASAKNQNQNQ